ncbi:sulfite exporter TauE/SafE family protein [Litoribacter alkaliphilus]|uniref:Sulfite exporter TauE/SafE family protein n=1 Tax=Litoribacter ruber TaxID=702568 RepID=A0AAP2CFX8_9BACT|nr:sulfite exporter TauE/SafE family protein [Litoribacter alkaliphilus]MBS9523292.1 sulfite exporter TauE/SafE family protein [Litoribacter alkaliphilus]
MAIWTALTLGFVGSFHCVGMCGPIALALPGKNGNKSAFFLNRLNYNLGRVTTYALLGLLFGLLGTGIAMAGFQKSLSVILGIVILLSVFLPAAIQNQLSPSSRLAQMVNWLKGQIRKQFQKRGMLSAYSIGVLNGFLPCGLVYLAIAASLLQNSPAEASIYMAAFGMGTLPAMITLVFAGSFASLKFRNNIRQVIPFVTGVFGIVLIVRGLGLGIPFLSPVLEFVEAGITMCGLK